MKKSTSPFARVMQSTSVVSALLTGLFLLLWLRSEKGWLLSVAITFGTTFYHFAMRLLVGALVPTPFHAMLSGFGSGPGSLSYTAN